MADDRSSRTFGNHMDGKAHVKTRESIARAFAPGRTELAGNHTDHQGGRVIAATLDCGVELIAQSSGSTVAHVDSPGFASVDIDLGGCLDVEAVAPQSDEKATTAALVRGVVAGLRAAGVPVAGFDARVKSDIPAGGGLSSSAAFELALTHALVLLAGQAKGGVPEAPDALGGARPRSKGTTPDSMTPLQLARIGQDAERDWFGKPCGLMDQLSIALGGINEIDFSSPDAHSERIDFDFDRAGYALFLIDTHCDHSRYTHEYAQVAEDMHAVSRFFGAAGLVEVSREEFLARLSDVRSALGDLPALRGLHYYHEMALVEARSEALRAGDVAAFLDATRRSSASSAQYLQNVSVADRAEQPAMVALALADHLAGPRGAVRIHGGGFGGTIQAFVPVERADDFKSAIDAQLGAGSCKRYRITTEGAHAAWLS